MSAFVLHLLAALDPPGLFSEAFMQNAWIAGTAVAAVAALVGFFVVLRGSSFVAHAVPRGSFAGAAGAVLIGQSTLLGLGVFAALSALGIASLGERRRHDAMTGLVLVTALGLGDLFLAIGHAYAPEVFALLFGQIVGISRREVYEILALSLVIASVLVLAYRPFLLTSIQPDIAAARGVRVGRADLLFLLLVSLAAAATVPVVGALLSFSLMVGPPAAGSVLAKSPPRALGLGVAFALVSVWISIWLAYLTNWPISFWVSALCLLVYVLARMQAGVTRRSTRLRSPAAPPLGTGDPASALAR